MTKQSRATRTLTHPPETAAELDEVLAGRAEVAQRGPLADAVADLRRSVWRLRRQILPQAATLGTLAIGGTLQLVNQHTDHAHAATLTVGGGLVLLLVLAICARYVLRRRVNRRWRRRAAAALAIGAGWILVAGLWMNPTLIALLFTAEFALAARWWRRHRITAPDPRPASLPNEPEPAPTVDPVIAAWEQWLGCPGGQLAGATLSEPTPCANGTEYTLGLVRGKQLIKHAMAVQEYIAQGLGEPVTRIVVKDHPSQKLHLATLKVLTHTWAESNPPWQGPQWDNGIVRIGPYVDGVGEAGWRLWTPDPVTGGNAWSGAVIGGTGTGKSRVIEAIGASALSSGRVVLWFLDPQSGVSSPALQRHADWYTDLDGADAMLTALEQVTLWRGKDAGAYGRTGFVPSPELPLLLVIIDEAHEVMEGRWAKRISKLVRKMRKLGVSLILVSQHPGIETFGGDEALRSSVMMGNGICFHTASNYAGSLMHGLEMDPGKLPKIPGYGYTVRVEGWSSLAPFRNRLIPDAEQVLAAAAADAATLDPLAVNAAGPAYRDRRQRAEEIAAASRAEVEAMRAGQLHARPTAAAPLSAPDEVADLGLDLKQLTWSETAVRSDESPTLSPAHQAVLDAIGNGHSMPAEISQSIGRSVSRVHQLLDDLRAAGHVTRTGHGRYQHHVPGQRRSDSMTPERVEISEAVAAR